jgi:hypothetical protein
MNINIGFCEVGLLSAAIIAPHSLTLSITLICACLGGKIVNYSVEFQEKKEGNEQLKKATDDMKASLELLRGSYSNNPMKKKPKSGYPTLAFSKKTDEDIEQ